MTPTNRRVLATFLASMAAFVAAVVAWDVQLYQSAPEGVNTISWAMALMGRTPLAVFALGHATGAVLWGLAFHFWFPQPSPAMWDELTRLRILEAEWKRTQGEDEHGA